jgi:serine/threonine protein kinase
VYHTPRQPHNQVQPHNCNQVTPRQPMSTLTSPGACVLMPPISTPAQSGTSARPSCRRRTHGTTFEAPHRARVAVSTHNEHTALKIRGAKMSPAMAAASATCTLHRLTLHGVLGQGGLGTVYSATQGSTRGDVPVAVKVMTGDNNLTLASHEREIAALTVLGTVDGVVRTFNHFCDSERTYVVMELVRGEELFDLVGRQGQLRENQARNVIRQVVQAVAEIHGRGWVHGDLKLENVMHEIAEEGNNPDPDWLSAKIIDFGFARRQSSADEHLRGFVGTALYSSPEMVFRRDYDARACDMYAVGVMLFAMLYGEYPFPDRGAKGICDPKSMTPAMKKAFTPRGVPYLALKGVSAEARDVIRHLLGTEPERRPTAVELLGGRWLAQEMCPPSPPVTPPRRAEVEVRWSCRERLVPLQHTIAGSTTSYRP